MSLLSRTAMALGVPYPYATLDSPIETVEHGPRHVWAEPTTRCNTRCRHCKHYYETFGADMDVELYEKISQSILPSASWAELCGYGEPLLARNFQHFFDDCARRGIPIIFTSNGILLRDRQRADFLVRQNVTINLSVDGARKETYEFIRPLIPWHKTIETLENLKRAADEAGDEKKFTLRFNFVPVKDSIADLPDMVRLAAKYGAQMVAVLPLAGEDHFGEMAGQSPEHVLERMIPAVREAMREARRLKIQLALSSFTQDLVKQTLWGGIALRWNQLLQSSPREVFNRIVFGPRPHARTGLRTCGFPWQGAYISTEGDVFACCVNGEVMGNLKTQSWAEIWNGPLYRNMRRTVHSWNPTRICRSCCMPVGIHGGDEKHYERFFARFKVEELPLEKVAFGEGFFEEQVLEDPPAVLRWMGKSGSLAIPAHPRATFLRLKIVPRIENTIPLNCGTMQLDHEPPEPFDNTCGEIVLPLKPGRSNEGSHTVRITMEEVFKPATDPRTLGLAIHGLGYLLP